MGARQVGKRGEITDQRACWRFLIWASAVLEPRESRATCAFEVQPSLAPLRLDFPEDAVQLTASVGFRQSIKEGSGAQPTVAVV